MTHNTTHVRAVKEWLMDHWETWCWVMPGNGDAMFELLKELKEVGLIRSLSNSHSTVALALRMARNEMRKPVNALP